MVSKQQLQKDFLQRKYQSALVTWIFTRRQAFLSAEAVLKRLQGAEALVWKGSGAEVSHVTRGLFSSTGLEREKEEQRGKRGCLIDSPALLKDGGGGRS